MKRRSLFAGFAALLAVPLVPKSAEALEGGNCVTGTWTPSYYPQSGAYTKIGNLIHIEGYLMISGKPHQISGVFPAREVLND